MLVSRLRRRLTLTSIPVVVQRHQQALPLRVAELRGGLVLVLRSLLIHMPILVVILRLGLRLGLRRVLRHQQKCPS